MPNTNVLSLSFLRQQIIGINQKIETPFGERLMLYADYTASGKGLVFVEKYLHELSVLYANSHTEDDTTGRTMTELLHQAEALIKRCVNAGPQGRIICTGTGATGAIEKMQQIVGTALTSATNYNLENLIGACFEGDSVSRFNEYCHEHQPIVFVGSYEHHSNEVTWRESLASVVEVDLDEHGRLNLDHLERLLQKPDYQDRIRIGSFSAASNVTGLKSPVHKIAALLHKYDALAFVDYAASAPYVEIDMNPEESNENEDSSLDAIFISPHKFVGGPGSSGVLVFNERCYHSELAPTVAGGGTVDFVGPNGHDFIDDIETREKAGTPGILQTIRAALAFDIKQAVGAEAIEKRETDMLQRAFQRWNAHPYIEILGNTDPALRTGIVSFNLKDSLGSYLHPRLVTTLLDDLFGIQSRAGCSCAGPYGHKLLSIDVDTAQHYRQWVAKGYHGIKPGWCRVGFHYLFDELDTAYLIDCVEFLADFGHIIQQLYHFEVKTGKWNHSERENKPLELSVFAAIAAETVVAEDDISSEERKNFYQSYLTSATALVNDLMENECSPDLKLKNGLSEVQFFNLSDCNLN